MKKSFFLVTLFLIYTSLFSNTIKIDSLNLRLNTADSIKKIELLIELSLEYVVIDTLKSLEFSNQALELSDQIRKHKAQAIGNSGYIYYLIGNHETSLKLLLKALTQLDLENDLKIRADILKNIGFVYTEFHNYNRSLEYFNKALNIYLELELKTDISIIYYSIGNIYGSQDKYEKALQYFHKSLSLDEELGDKEGMAILYYNIGEKYELLAEYVKALESYFDCLKVYEKLADRDGISDSYNAIGNIFQTLGDFDVALEYYNKYLEIQKEIEDKSRISIAYNNIGIIYDDNKDFDKALEYYFNALEIDEELNDKEGIATITNNLGLVYYQLKDYDKALEYYQQSLSLSKELNDIWAIANTSNNIAELYLDLTQYAESFSYVDKGFEYAESIEVKDVILESFHIYSKLYSKTNNYQRAFEYFKKYTDLKDTLFTTSIRKVAEIQMIHETEKKEKEIELLLKNNMIYKLEIEKHKLERWIVYLSLIIVLALIFITYYFYNMKKKANQILEKLVKKRTKELQIKIIERKSIEKSLRKSEEKYRTLVETIDEGVGNVDENENFTFVNKAAANIFGCSKEELVGKNFKKFTSKEEFNKILIQTSIRKQRKSSNYELSIQRKDGAMRVIYVTTTAIIRSDGKYRGAFGIFHDITDQKKMEKQLLRSERLAGVGELATGIAHEIRNPLGTISAVSQLYISKYKLDKEQKELFEIILRNCEDTDKVIRELIDFTNPHEISLELKDICKVIDNFLKHLYAVSVIHKVNLIKNCPKKLPQILIDEKWLESALSNCFTNALDSMPDGGDLTVTVFPDHKNNEIIVTLLDTGVGISKENLDKIFDPFFTTKQDGIGLGLFLVHQIITAHNGRLNIESEAGKDTKVIIRLPIPRESREKKRIEPQTNTDKHRQKKVSFK